MSLKEQIQKSSDIRTEPVDLPEWGEGFFVRVMTGRQRADFERMAQGKNPRDMREQAAVFCLSDKEGGAALEQLDIAWLRDKSSIMLDRVFDAAIKLNTLRPEDIDELGKTSAPTTDGDSSSG